MGQLIISNLTGLVPPYSGYVCDVYGNQCVYIGEIVPPTTITLPSQFDTAPAIGFRILSNPDCDKLTILYCNPPEEKQFQDGEFFFFMDNEAFQFQ